LGKLKPVTPEPPNKLKM